MERTSSSALSEAFRPKIKNMGHLLHLQELLNFREPENFHPPWRITTKPKVNGIPMGSFPK